MQSGPITGQKAPVVGGQGFYRLLIKLTTLTYNYI